MIRILWINPVGTDAFDAPIGAELRSEAAPSTRVDVCSLPGAGPQHLEWNALEAVVAGPTMGVVRWAAEQQAYDAAVIGCFYDPFLRGARELSGAMAVTAPAEACLHIAATIGERIAILVGRRKWIPEMHENVVKYGYGNHLASFRVLDMSVDEFQADPETTQQRILAEAERAVHDDRADAVVLGCTIEFGCYREVQDKVGVLPSVTPSSWPPSGPTTAGGPAASVATTRCRRANWIGFRSSSRCSTLIPGPERCPRAV